MKNVKWLFVTLIAVSMWSCSGEDSLNPDSIFVDNLIPNAFDRWLAENYVKTYNIDFKYRLENKETDHTYNLVPAEYTKAIAMAKMTKHLWIGSYEELLGTHFMRSYAPRVLCLVGSPAYNPTSGTELLGTAEGGMKITLYKVNALNLSSLSVDALNDQYFHTMHHEFAHILNQIKEYTTDFNLVTPSNYQGPGWSVSSFTLKNALDLGFVTKYASMEPREDFVEVFSIYITSTAASWTSRMNTANAEGQSLINRKLEIVKDYTLTVWGFDLDDLRDIVLRRSNEVLTMNLTTLD